VDSSQKDSDKVAVNTVMTNLEMSGFWKLEFCQTYGYRQEER